MFLRFGFSDFPYKSFGCWQPKSLIENDLFAKEQITNGKRPSGNRFVDCVAGALSSGLIGLMSLNAGPVVRRGCGRLVGGVEMVQGNRGSFDSLRCAPVAQDDSPVLVGWLCHRQTGDKRGRKQILRFACLNALRAPGPQAAPLRMTARWVGPEVVLCSGWQGF